MPIDKKIERFRQMLRHIDETLSTKNLKPEQQKGFLDMKEYLNEELRYNVQEALRRDLRISAYKEAERDLPPIVGESSPYDSFLIPGQSGEVKTYDRNLPATTIRKFHPNINDDMDSEMSLHPNLRDRPEKL